MSGPMSARPRSREAFARQARAFWRRADRLSATHYCLIAMLLAVAIILSVDQLRGEL